MVRTYSDLIRLPTFEERYAYLKLKGCVGDVTFGSGRYLNQMLYASNRWRQLRHEIIVRDNGYDLACEGYLIPGQVTIHHINPLRLEDIETDSYRIYDHENLICVSRETHKALHFGKALTVQREVTRSKHDTCPWKIKGG